MPILSGIDPGAVSGVRGAADPAADRLIDGAATLGILSAVERHPQATQRRLSRDVGIALGLANAILKRCVRHGLVKISQAPFNRYSYYLTPTGFAEKSRLTVEHLRYSFNLFRDARAQYAEILRRAAASGYRRVGLLGASELAEAALLSASEVGVAVAAVFDDVVEADSYVGIPVLRDLRALLDASDMLLLTDMRAPHAMFARATDFAHVSGFDRSRIAVPALLGILPGDVPQSRAIAP